MELTPNERPPMTSNWDTTRQRILRQDRTETAILCLTAIVAGVAAILILTLGDSHPGATKFIGGGALTLLLQASIAGLFPGRTRRAWKALTAPTTRRMSGCSRPRARYAHSPTPGGR